NVGGVWNFTPLPATANVFGRPRSADRAIDVATANLPALNTPMYQGLESNLPHMLMQYSDAPFPEGTQLFASRENVMDYLENYAQDVKHLNKYQNTVMAVTPQNIKNSYAWEVTIRDGQNETHLESFDAVVAANESIHHSVSYKNAISFVDKRVLLVGGGPSGADIGNQIAAKCRHPLLRSQTVKSPYHTDEPYIHDFPALVALIPEQRAARFADGSVERDIDVVVLCTGYTYRFPFLTVIHPKIEEEGIATLPLYQHIFHMQYPTLAFIETPEMIVPFPLAECQAAVVARVWSGRLPLPNQHAMEKWRNQVIAERGPSRQFHALKPPLDLEYMKEMYNWCTKAENAKSHTGVIQGKMPKRWDDKSCWLRMMAAEMKKSFNARGAERSMIETYEELGYQYDGGPV
ncbi:MAG: hypothetical protein Q9180_008748, partial [Flavoplaca navasiana]